MQKIYHRALDGDIEVSGIEPEAFHLSLGDSELLLDNNENGIKVEGTKYARRYSNGLAVLDLIGPIFPRANLMTEYSGAVSISTFAQDFFKVYHRNDVKAVVINIDSPGGAATGVGDAAAIINKLVSLGQKPVISYATGIMASGAYWIGAAVGAGNMYASETAIIGSIGVVTTLMKRRDNVIEMVSSKSPYKRLDVDNDGHRALIQQRLDDMAEIFIGDVAKYRGVTDEKVSSDFGQGNVLVSARAAKAGMIDGIGLLSEIAGSLVRDNTVGKTATKLKSEESTDMGLKDILKDHLFSADNKPEVAEEVTDRASLEDQFSTDAELFVAQMIIGNKMLAASAPNAISDLVTAMVDDQLHPAEVTYVNSSGDLVTGTRVDAVKSRIENTPKPVTKTVSVLQKETIQMTDEVKGAVVLETDKEADTSVSDEVTEDRVKSLLGYTHQGRKVLENK